MDFFNEFFHNLALLEFYFLNIIYILLYIDFILSTFFQHSNILTRASHHWCLASNIVLVLVVFVIGIFNMASVWLVDVQSVKQKFLLIWILMWNILMMWVLHGFATYYGTGHLDMMTSSNGNIFRVTGPLCGEFTGDLWIPHTKGQRRGALMFPLICDWINGWVNNRGVGDLTRHWAHYDVTVMNIWFCVCYR